MDIANVSNINLFFDDLLKDIKCQTDTKSYIVGVYSKYKTTQFDLSNDSITMLFAQARYTHSFASYQNLGDYLLFFNTIVSLENEHQQYAYYNTIGKLSYDACYKLINKKWQLFAELSQNLDYLEYQIKRKLYDELIRKSDT